MISPPGAQIGGTASLTVEDPSSGFFAPPTILIAPNLRSSNSTDLQSSNQSGIQGSNPPDYDSLQLSIPSNLQLSKTSDTKTFPSNLLEADFPVMLIRHFKTVQELV